MRSLNIKKPEAHRLATAIAQETWGDHDSRGDRSIAGTARESAKPSRKAGLEELSAIAKRAAAHLKRPYLDHGELLHDEHGRPR
jgi:antitoxin VapB